jgi:hypothetical protein
VSPVAKQRADVVFRATERLGLPTVLALLFFWAFNGVVREDRATAAEERRAFVASVQANTEAVRALAAQVETQGRELHDLGERVSVLASARGTR